MEPKEFDFEFPRGDTMPYAFELTDKEGNALNLDSAVEITMTARDAGKNIVFQKKLSRSEIVVKGKVASTVIEHRDTENLKIGGKYKYDVEFSRENYYITLIKGVFTLTEEQTY